MGREKKPSKRRGRPLSDSPEDDTSDVIKVTIPPIPSSLSILNHLQQARRQRNREAQNVFRKRRQAAEAEQTARLRRLEEVVEEMSSIYMSFVDEMLQTEAVKQDARLVGSLRGSTKRILGLVHEVVGPDEGGMGEAMAVGKGLSDGEESSAWMDPQFIARPTPPPTEQLPFGLSLAKPSDMMPSQPVTMNMGTVTPPEPILDPVIDPSDPVFPDLLPQIYSDGWTITPPTPPPPPPSFSSSPPQDSDSTFYSLAPDSFAYRLVKATLTTAYLILSQSKHPPVPLSEEKRIFASTLRYRSRDELLTRMRWILGPGSNELSRVADMPYGRWGEDLISGMDLRTGTGDYQPAAVEDTDHVPETSKFLSVAGVEKQLIALGARVLDAETLELNITGPAISTDPGDDMSWWSDSWGFVNVFSSDMRRPKSTGLKLRLSVSKLVHNLSSNAVCLMRGPGFSRIELGKAIQASIVTAH